MIKQIVSFFNCLYKLKILMCTTVFAASDPVFQTMWDPGVVPSIALSCHQCHCGPVAESPVSRWFPWCMLLPSQKFRRYRIHHHRHIFVSISMVVLAQRLREKGNALCWDLGEG